MPTASSFFASIEYFRYISPMFRIVAILITLCALTPSLASIDPNEEQLSFTANESTYVLLLDTDWQDLLTDKQKELLALPKLGTNLSADYAGDRPTNEKPMVYEPSDDCDDLNALMLHTEFLEGPPAAAPFVSWDISGISTMLLERGVGLQIALHSADGQKTYYQRGFLRFRPDDEIVVYQLPFFMNPRIVVSPDGWNTFMNLANLMTLCRPGHDGKKEAILLAPFLDPFLEGIYKKLQEAGYTINSVDVPPICTAIEQEQGEGRNLKYLPATAAGFSLEETQMLRKEWNLMRRSGKSMQDCQQVIFQHVSLKLFSPITALKLGQIYLPAEFANLSAMVMQLYPPEPQADGRLLTLNGMGGMTPVIDKITEQWINASARLHMRTLEIGTSYGLALMKAIEAGAENLTANDVDVRHLMVFARTLKLRFPDYMDKVKLIPGRFPRDFELSPRYDCMLMARVLHFMNKEELFQAMRAAFEVLYPGGWLYIVALTPYVGAYKPFINEFAKRKQEGHPYPGYVQNLADWTDAKLIPPEKQKAMGLHTPFMFLDPDTLCPLAKQVGFSIVESTFMALPYKSDLWGLDGRENVGMILQKPHVQIRLMHKEML